MKYFKYICILFAAVFIIFTSCKKDDEDTTDPVISGLEIGVGNSKVLYQGGDVHLQFEASDDTELGYYKVEIHYEGKGVASEWEYSNQWNFETGLKNSLIHHHDILVPPDADPGDYHFHLTLVDKAGNSASEEHDVEVKVPTDTTAPVISVTTIPSGSYSTGDTIRIAGNVTENDSLGGVYIALMKTSDNIPDSEIKPPCVSGGTAIAGFLHNHDFPIPDSYSFDVYLVVGQTQDNDYHVGPCDISWGTGDYYVVVKSPDKSGNVGFSQHYPITLN